MWQHQRGNILSQNKINIGGISNIFFKCYILHGTINPTINN